VIPAVVIGVISSLIYYLVSAIAAQLQNFLWTTIPQAMGIASTSPVWTLLMLTLTGVGVGLVVWKMPGHAGPDPATMGLVEAPLELKVLPSLLLALILMLAGGVSLGPENPIMAVNTGLIFAIGIRLIPAVGTSTWVGLSVSGMLGAMFDTPVGAALTLSESPPGDPHQPLFDRLFAPLVAAGAGAITMDALTGGGYSFTLSLQPYPNPHFVDLFTGGIIAVIAALLGLAAVYAFPIVHRAFHRIPNPMVVTVVGGILLGILGVIGGQITLFKGIDQMKELAQDVSSYSAAQLALITIIKLAALLVAASSGFRGGRIFPSVFVGVAMGLCANALFPSIPQAIAVSCGVLGILLAITRQGWLSLFMAALMVADPAILPILCIILLPAWLLVTGKPPMQILKAHTDVR
jgi:H+/Cl- antiporter ClcA